MTFTVYCLLKKVVWHTAIIFSFSDRLKREIKITVEYDVKLCENNKCARFQIQMETFYAVFLKLTIRSQNLWYGVLRLLFALRPLFSARLTTTVSVCTNTPQHLDLTQGHDSGVYVHVWVGLLGVFSGAQWATRECYHSGSCPVNEFGWLWITCRV